MKRTPIGPNTLLFGDCIEWLKQIPSNTFTACVSDPPYGLDFMGKDWDAPWRTEMDDGISKSDTVQQMRGFQNWCEQWGREIIRVLKPGGHILLFSGTRTYHRMVCGIEEAGFQVRDKMDFFCELEDYHSWTYGSGFPKSHDISKAIDRLAGVKRKVVGQKAGTLLAVNPGHENDRSACDLDVTASGTKTAAKWEGYGTALKPAHEPVAIFTKTGEGQDIERVVPFSYVPKSSRRERNLGCKNLFWITKNDKTRPISKQEYVDMRVENHQRRKEEEFEPHPISRGNTWPTVKPIELMRYLVRMVKMPEENLILEPFMGSGTTPCACILEGCDFVAMDMDPVAFRIAKARVTYFECLGHLGLQ